MSLAAISGLRNRRTLYSKKDDFNQLKAMEANKFPDKLSTVNVCGLFQAFNSSSRNIYNID